MESSGQIAASTAPALTRPRLEAASPRYGERLIYWLLAACAGISVLTTTAIVFSLLIPTVEFFGEVPVVDFLLGTDWGPTFTPAITTAARGLRSPTSSNVAMSLKPLGPL